MQTQVRTITNVRWRKEEIHVFGSHMVYIICNLDYLTERYANRSRLSKK
jgi:hypothetical protein